LDLQLEPTDHSAAANCEGKGSPTQGGGEGEFWGGLIEKIEKEEEEEEEVEEELEQSGSERSGGEGEGGGGGVILALCACVNGTRNVQYLLKLSRPLEASSCDHFQHHVGVHSI